MIEKLESLMLELPETTALLSDINELDAELVRTEFYLDEVRSRISLWDRINIFSSTDEEGLEEELNDAIGEQSEKMVHMLARLDDITEL